MTPLSKEQIYEKLFTLDVNFSNEHYADFANVSKSSDPVLQNIALLLTEHFTNIRIFNKIHNNPNHYCDLLNKWLNEKELLYTCAGKCEKNKNLWDNHIEGLWYSLSNVEVDIVGDTENDVRKEKQNWCKRSRLSVRGSFPQKWIPKSCSNSISDICSEISPPNADVPSSISIIPLSLGYALLGIILISIFLYKFTSIGPSIKGYLKKKRLFSQNVNEGDTEQLENYYDNMNIQFQNRLNSVFYQSM
ncbi:PIR Superfamily Protein [Plasmodium ovale curtisi]|uniref:PIR Superfamily Protein n=1 Tax=Plasmodium ovale curtisi TaxID=864141 RepID=A0A1A8WFT2_PLAOA|nr:PIR Superfamily Protein [Plasmodium ovale curtisi]